MTLDLLLHKPVGEEPDQAPKGFILLIFLGNSISIMFAERLWSRQDKKLYSWYPIPRSIPLHFLILVRHMTVRKYHRSWKSFLWLLLGSRGPLVDLPLPRSVWGNLGTEVRSVPQGAAASRKHQNRCVCAIHSHRVRTGPLFSYFPKEMRSKPPFHSNTRLFVCPKLLPTWRAGGKAFEWTMQYSVTLYCIAYVPGLSCISTEKHSPLVFSLCIPVHCPPSPSLCCLTTCFLQATKNIHLTFVTGRCFLCKHKYLEKFTKD